VSAFTPVSGAAGGGVLRAAGRIAAGRHPSAMVVDRAGSRLYVASASTDSIAVVDVAARRVVGHLADRTPGGTVEGSTPNALATSADGARLYVAEADNNAVAVFSVPGDSLLGRMPVEWYPTALVAAGGDTLDVVSGKGRGSRPNAANGPGPGRSGGGGKTAHADGYTLGQLSGTFAAIVVPRDGAALSSLTARVARANSWDRRRDSAAYPPFTHVLYIIKENRTYDQVLGDLAQADGDTSLVFFGRAVTPNHHALAERYGVWDRFMVNAEVSGDGHPWSTAAYATDYVEKTVPSNYSGRGRSYDYEGTNRDTMPKDGDDVAAPVAGYLWDLAVRKGLTLRDYGEFVVEKGRTAETGVFEPPAVGAKPALVGTTNPDFPPFNLSITDQHRADVYLAELTRFVASGSMPALEIMHLGNDHTAGGRPGSPTPKAMVADNDLALGRIVAALSRTPFWASTVIFVVEDDAQNGPDHVDSHRAPVLVISPYSKPGVTHRFANTTDVLATIEEILGLGSLSQFDRYGRPMRDAFGAVLDPTPYTVLTPTQSLTELNPDTGKVASLSRRLPLGEADEVEDGTFNRILWLAVKGPDVPQPAPRRASTAALIGLR